VILARGVSLAAPAQRHAVSDIYTTDHNRLPSVDCDTFGLTADVSGIKVWVIPLQFGPTLPMHSVHGVSHLTSNPMPLYVKIRPLTTIFPG
jgi:hypothetical protein